MAAQLLTTHISRAVLRNIFLLMVLISFRGWLKPQGLVWLEGLGKMKKKLIHLTGSRTRDLPACSLYCVASVQDSLFGFCVNIFVTLVTQWYYEWKSRWTPTNPNKKSLCSATSWQFTTLNICSFVRQCNTFTSQTLSRHVSISHGHHQL
jgi:hypothetical protein